MDKLIAKEVEFNGDILKAAQDPDGNIYTGYLWTEEEFKCGGHDLLKILEGNMGKYIHIEIELYSRC